MFIIFFIKYLSNLTISQVKKLFLIYKIYLFHEYGKNLLHLTYFLIKKITWLKILAKICHL